VNILLAGASGAIGRRLLPRLLERGHEVWALTRAETKRKALAAQGARALVADVLDEARLAAVMAEARPQVVISQLSDLPQLFSVRTMKEAGPRNNRLRREGVPALVRAAVAAGARRFVLQSVAFWYEPHAGGDRTEEAPLLVSAPPPIGTAAAAMETAERAVLDAPLEAVILRYGFFYGPGTWYAREGDIGRQVRRRRYPLIGNGGGRHSFVHIDDAADASTLAVELLPPGAYNAVDDDPAPAREWLPAFATALGAPHPRKTPAMVARLLVGSATVDWMLKLAGASNQKLRQAGWHPTYPSWRTGFAEGLG
jgi:nucleoside-diphosphate-sugar epimerase